MAAVAGCLPFCLWCIYQADGLLGKHACRDRRKLRRRRCWQRDRLDQPVCGSPPDQSRPNSRGPALAARAWATLV